MLSRPGGPAPPGRESMPPHPSLAAKRVELRNAAYVFTLSCTVPI
jgi:hypothetical protein